MRRLISQGVGLAALMGALVGLGIVALPFAHADEPLGTAFTYQGQLTRGGNPVTGQCDFEFRLFDAAGGGSQVGNTRSVSGVTVSRGLFTVELDFGVGAFDGTERWLEVGVRCPSGSGSITTLSPRQRLTAVPYALYARSGPYSAGAGLSLTGTQFSLLAGYQLPQSCSATQVPRWTGSAWGCENVWFWGGNAGTSVGTNFLGTTDGQALELKVNSQRALRLEPSSGSPNVVGGSVSNTVTSGVMGATIGGGGAAGSPNRVTDDYGVVGGGSGNRAGNDSGPPSDAAYAAVGGGQQNSASSVYATVGGGQQNSASNFVATVGGGYGNTASGGYATVGGGELNVAAGSRATVGGGYGNTAAGDYSFVVGRHAKNSNSAHPGVFLFADSTSVDFPSTAANQFRVRATGGVQFVLGVYGSGNPTWTCSVSSGNSWSCSSDRALKENLVLADGRAVLAQLAGMPLYYWNAKGADPASRHLGPMAQDFFAAFGVGTDDTSIATIDLDGVALAAIQGLFQHIQDLERAQAGLEGQNRELQQELAALQQQLAALAAEGASGRASTAPAGAPLLTERLTALEQQNASLQQQNAALQQELVDLRADHASLQQQNAALEARLAALEQRSSPFSLPLGLGLPGLGLVLGGGLAWAVRRPGRRP